MDFGVRMGGQIRLILIGGCLIDYDQEWLLDCLIDWLIGSQIPIGDEHFRLTHAVLCHPKLGGWHEVDTLGKFCQFTRKVAHRSGIDGLFLDDLPVKNGDCP